MTILKITKQLLYCTLLPPFELKKFLHIYSHKLCFNLRVLNPRVWGPSTFFFKDDVICEMSFFNFSFLLWENIFSFILNFEIGVTRPTCPSSKLEQERASLGKFLLVPGNQASANVEPCAPIPTTPNPSWVCQNCLTY